MQRLEAQAARLKGPAPGLWLVTDATRLPNPLPAARRLPPGSAVLARDLAAPMLRALAAVARARRLRLVVAGDGRLALAHGAGLHLAERRPNRHVLPFLLARRPAALLAVAAHGRAGLARARRLRADVVLLSPAFSTASHPGAPALGPLRWAALAARAPWGVAVVALGGLNYCTAGRLPRRHLAGLAAIGALAPPPVARP